MVVISKRNITRIAMLAAGCLVLLVGRVQTEAGENQPAADKGSSAPASVLPRLVDLGAGKCIPCKKMKPILDQLREEYQGRMEVVFIDVRENPDEATAYGIRTIPTQIFYDASGKERTRHEGFMSKEDILAQWKSLGVDLNTRQVKSDGNGPTMEQTYPGLVSGALTQARLGALADGLLLRAGDVQIKEDDLQAKVKASPESVRPQIKKNMLFLLEQEATEKLLLTMAKLEFGRTKTDITGLTPRQIIQKFIEEVVLSKVDVAEVELAAYYADNKDLCGNATFEQAKDQLKPYVLQEKQQRTVEQYLRTLGRRVPIVVSAAWTREQAKLARDNPVDQARASGKPSVVDFGSVGCRPCDMMTPILKTLKEKYQGRANVLFVHVREESLLASRYGIRTIPVQIFFDKDGKEVYRHMGYFPQPDIEKKLRDMGVK